MLLDTIILGKEQEPTSTTLQFGEAELEVMNKISLEEMVFAVEMAVTRAMDDIGLNKAVAARFLDIYILRGYTNIEFLEEDYANLYLLHDKISNVEFNLFDEVCAVIDKKELEILYILFEKECEKRMNFKTSFRGMISEFITRMPEALKEIEEVMKETNYNPEMMKNLLDIARDNGLK